MYVFYKRKKQYNKLNVNLDRVREAHPLAAHGGGLLLLGIASEKAKWWEAVQAKSGHAAQLRHVLDQVSYLEKATRQTQVPKAEPIIFPMSISRRNMTR